MLKLGTMSHLISGVEHPQVAVPVGINTTNFITIERFELPKVTKSYESCVIDLMKIGCLESRNHS